MSSKCRAVNLRKEQYDVYIGRAGKGEDGYFGNPYRGRKQAVLDKFRPYFFGRLERDPEYRRRVLALKGKRLGCFCKPGLCHGDIIAEWVNEHAG